MSDQREIIAAHEARIVELERNLAVSQQRRPSARSRLSRRRVAAFGVMLALLAVPGVVLASHGFSDVDDLHPFHDDIDWMADYGIANGFDDGTYRPGQAVTRQAMAAFMHRLSNELELVSSDIDPGLGTSFTHSATCPDDKRAISGGARHSETFLFVTDSYPEGASWFVRWATNNVAIDPTLLRVHALCAPRL